jgi:Ricin-type beta-trefoil lectin domain-like
MKSFSLLLICLAAIIGSTSGIAVDSPADSLNSKTSAPASFQVRNKKFGDLLRPEDANNANGTRLVLYSAQPWKCMTWKFHPAGESAFQLQNYFTSKTFAPDTKVEKEAQPVTQVPFAKPSGECPTWRFTKLPDGTYKITDSKSGMVLTAVKADPGSTATIIVQAWQEKAEQKWELIPIDPKQLTM